MHESNAKRKFLDILRDTPLISYAAKLTGISRATIYRWQKDDYHFRREVEKVSMEGRRHLIDMCEMTLLKKIKDGDIRSTIYYLSHNERRYYPKRNIEVLPLKPEELKPGERCGVCGEKKDDPVSTETKERIRTAFGNFGLIKE